MHGLTATSPTTCDASLSWPEAVDPLAVVARDVQVATIQLGTRLALSKNGAVAWLTQPPTWQLPISAMRGQLGPDGL